MRRSGFTLLELILVMVLIVMAGALTAPLVDSMMHPNQVSASIDTVRAQWEQTRSRAMEEGRPYRFSIQEGGAKYRIEPDDVDTNDETGFIIDGELPEPCLFVESASGPIDPGRSAVDSGAWKIIAVFLPDGTARENVDLSFGRAGLVPATLRLRSLTGSVSQVKQEVTP